MSRHVPVLLNEVVESLQLKSGMNIVDCTLGDGGHAEKILLATAPTGRVLGIDADPESLLRAKQFLYSFGERVIFARSNFANVAKAVAKNNFQPVNGILIDLGWSSPQFEERGRGFSFLKDEPLDMRYGTELIINNYPPSPIGASDGRGKLIIKTAADVVNNLGVAELEKIFREYGEEKLSKEISIGIIEYRRKQEIKTTKQLVDIILRVYRKKLKTEKEIPWVGGLHPATKVFQALRMAVNRELAVLEEVLPAAIEVLAPGGRLAVISFHSLEDRLVKHFFKKIDSKKIKIITKKPIVCAREEYQNNPRARSAKLRIAEKLK